MIRKKITPQQFFKSAGYNLWLVNDKKQPIKTTPTGTRVAIKEWSMITDFEPFYPSITAMDNIGFLSGLQYKSGSYLIILDFDIYSGKMQGVVPETQALFDEFRVLDTNGERGFFSGSTCHNYGVILDITDTSTIIDKINQIITTTNNRNKIEYQGLEILYKNNVVLPPSKTHCKKCQTTHQKREMLAKVMAVCIPNPKQVAFVLNIMDKFLEESKIQRILIPYVNSAVAISENNIGSTLSTTNLNMRLRGTNFETRHIQTSKMLALLDLYKNERFTCGYAEWIKFLYQVCNANNSDEVITKFWQRGAIGQYSNVLQQEIAKYFYSCNLIHDFNTSKLWTMAKDDSPVEYKKLFESYDEPQFAFKPITFIDSTTNQPSSFINYQQIINHYANITNNKFRIIKSGLGTGKTSMIREHLLQQFSNNKATRVIFITCRQTLADNISGTFEHLDFLNYLDVKHIDHHQSRIIISLDSLCKIAYYDYDKYTYKINPYNIVICDEICSLLKHFSFKLMKTPEIIYNIFEDIIQESKETWFLDGDISNREISWLKEYMEYDTATNPPICNSINGTSYSFSITYCASQQYSHFINDLKNGMRVCIVCMSATEAKTLDSLLSQKFKTLCILSETSDIIKKQCNKINQIIINYQCFIFSPCITVGVDINVHHFDKVYSYVCKNSVCPRDFFQMLGRIRNPKYNTIELLLADFDMKINGLYNVYPFDKWKFITWKNRIITNPLHYIQLWNQWEQKHSDELWLDVFYWYAEAKGHKVNFQQNTKQIFKDGHMALKKLIDDLQLKTQDKTETARDIYNAWILEKESKLFTNSKYSRNNRENIDIRNSILLKEHPTEEDNELLIGIDIICNMDNLLCVKDRIQNNRASTLDKLNYMKTKYWHFFGLSINLCYEEFEAYYYDKIHIVFNYLNLLFYIDKQKLRGNMSSFEYSLFIRRIEYFKKIMSILEIELSTITSKCKIKYSHINNKHIALTEALNNEDFKALFNIKVIKTGTKKIIDNTAPAQIIIRNNEGKKFVMELIARVLNYFGFVMISKLGRFEGIVNNYYELDTIKAINKYIDTYGTIIEYEF